MAVPDIRFTKNMTLAERSQSLNKMRDWCQSQEANESKVKATVLLTIIDYANKNLVVMSRLPFMSVDQANDLDCQICDAIFRHVDLPDILFLQHIINQINLIPDDPHPMKEKILPVVIQNKNTLMIPLIQETRAACGGAIALSLWSRFGWCLFASIIAILCSEQITNLRVGQALKNKLALKENGGKVARVEDGYDDILGGVSRFSIKTYNTVTTLFNNVLLPMIHAEKKEIPKPSLK